MKNHLMDMHKAQILSLFVTISFMLVHIGLYFMFREYGVTPMAYFNIGSIATYILMIPLIYKRKLGIFVIAVDIEVLLHMTLAVLFIGWNSGFQISLIGMSVLLYFSEYVARTLELPYTRSIILSIIGAAAYIASFCYINDHPAPYSLPPEIESKLQIAWAVIVFMIIISFLQIFVEITFRGEEFLAHRASSDELTGLKNRYYIMDYLKKIQKSEGLEGYYVAILDIDDFKQKNDTYGHNYGDYVLKTLAGILENNPCKAMACRWGGEEFILVGNTKYSTAEEQCELLDSLREQVENYNFTYNGQSLPTTITIGAARYEKGMSIEEWVNIADKKLYTGKYNGKNRVVV